MVEGVNHITLSVNNLDTAFDFYTKVLGLKALARKKAKSVYLLAGDNWLALVESKGGTGSTITSYAHLAFSVNEKEFAKLSERIKEAGVKIWQDNVSEGDSLYFLDPSGNQLEIHNGNWQSRIQWLRENPTPDVELFV